MEEPRLLLITDEDRQSFKRLDHYLVQRFPDLSRSLIKKIFDNGDITATQDQKLELKKRLISTDRYKPMFILSKFNCLDNAIIALNG